MKKEYRKPEIFIEDFNICQNIASGCKDTEGANMYQGGCTYYDEGWITVVFNETIQGCEDVDEADCQDAPNTYAGYFFS